MKHKSFRLSEGGMTNLGYLGKIYGENKTAVLRRLISEKYAQEIATGMPMGKLAAIPEPESDLIDHDTSDRFVRTFRLSLESCRQLKAIAELYDDWEASIVRILIEDRSLQETSRIQDLIKLGLVASNP